MQPYIVLATVAVVLVAMGISAWYFDKHRK